MKDIKKLLSEQSNNVLPDEKVKDNIKRELGFAETESALAYAHGGEENRRDKRRTICVVALFAAFVVAISIFIPLLLKNPNKPGLPGITPGNKFEKITDANSFYAYSAASAGIIISSQTTFNSPARALTADGAGKNEGSAGQIDVLNQYMSLVESLLSDGSIKGEGIENKLGYDFGMSVTYTDMLGKSVAYTMYYNKDFLGSESDGKDTEANYSINGILIVGADQYQVTGNYETEISSDESEDKLYFKAFTNEARTSYVEVSQENETENESSENEIEYSYSVYSSGILVEKTVLKYEKEDDELELIMTLEKDGIKEELVFKDETEDGERVLAVTGNVGGQEVRFRIYILEDKYHYVFEDGSSSDHDRYDDDEDEEASDNDDEYESDD